MSEPLQENRPQSLNFAWICIFSALFFIAGAGTGVGIGFIIWGAEGL